MRSTKVYLRVRQLGRAISSHPLTPIETAYVRQILTSSQTTLFEALPLYERRHALNVCRTLVWGGYGSDHELLQAALLHDLGKFDPATGRTIPIWLKVVNVVLGRRMVARLASERGGSWRYMFWLQAHHEKRGITLAESVGSSPRVIALLDGYSSLKYPADPSQVALAWADDLN